MEIHYTATALGHLEALDKRIRERILIKMRFYRLQKDPLSFAKPLTGHDAYRFRVGNYRVVCDVRAEVLRVLFIAKRDDVYRDL